MADTPKHFVQVLDLITARKEPTVRELGALEARHLRVLRKIFADKNVVGIGVSEKVIGRENTGRLSICFYVEKKLRSSQLRAWKMVPPVIAAPNGQAVFTDVKVVGKIRPQINVKRKPGQSGFSIGHKNASAGTLGAIVRKGRKHFVLSNSHVLAMSGTAAIGDPILYPGKFDGGDMRTDRFATLSKVVKLTPGGDLVNLCDAALAEIDPGRTGSLDFSILGINGIPQIVAPAIGMTVTKRGRSSGDTDGQVLDVNFRFAFFSDDLADDVGFTDQVLCTLYSEDGDSGAVVVAKDFGAIVGLHFAGSESNSVFSPMQPVVDALEFQFIAT